MGAKGTGRDDNELVKIDITKKLRDELKTMKKNSRGILKNYDDVIYHFINFMKKRIAHGK